MSTWIVILAHNRASGWRHARPHHKSHQVLADGVYLELISFTHPVDYYTPGSPEYVKRVGHWWARKSPGWIDYAALADAEVDLSEVINARSAKEGTRVVYLPPNAGGREKPDGTVLEWKTTFPEFGAHGRGALPFFCADVTPRNHRVRHLKFLILSLNRPNNIATA